MFGLILECYRTLTNPYPYYTQEKIFITFKNQAAYFGYDSLMVYGLYKNGRKDCDEEDSRPAINGILEKVIGKITGNHIPECVQQGFEKLKNEVRSGGPDKMMAITNKR